MNEKINIVYVVSSLKKCGPTNQLLGIIKNLNKKKFNVTVLTIFKEEKDSEISLFHSEKITVDSLELSNKINYPKVINKMKTYFSNNKTHIIHSTGLVADFCSCFIKDCIHISTIRNYAYYDYISVFGKLSGNIMIRLNKWAIENTDYPICCSKSIMMMYKKKINNKLYYIQNGVDIENYKPHLHGKNHHRKKLGLAEDKYIFIVSGSLTARKDPLFIIEAFNSLNTFNKACLLFIGDGELFEECKKYESENIIFKGSVSNVSDYLQSADAYISASKSEGLPNSVLEATACGLEIVLSSIPQHEEIFEDQKHLAHFFDLNNKNQLSNILTQLINKNEDSNYIASKYIINKFSSKTNSDNYANFYISVFNNDSLEEKCEYSV